MKKNKLIGYLGPEGTFSNEAVLNIIDDNTDIKAYMDILSIFESLMHDEIDEAIVPIENSTEGSVLVTLDALNYYDLKIKSEYFLPIKHYLLVQKDVTLDDISVICSHPQAIAQCRHYIKNINKKVHAMSSTANAARYVTEISSAAVIGNRILSKKYNLNIIDENIQDYQSNVTRFVVIAKDDQQKITGNDKTSVIISLYGDKPGGLYKILAIFAKEDINLTKIESRPSKEKMGKYLFFIDIEGHRKDSKLKKVLKEVEDNVEFFKILGSYHQIGVGGN